MPYEQETVVEHQGRMIREVISKGAFKGIQRRKIKANRDHDITKVVGHCVSLQPNRADGLVAEVKIANTLLGDETLTLANDGILDAIGGLPADAERGEQWEGRSQAADQSKPGWDMSRSSPSQPTRAPGFSRSVSPTRPARCRCDTEPGSFVPGYWGPVGAVRL